MVHDAGPVNDYGKNKPNNLAAGEGLLYLTDRRLLMFYEADGSTRRAKIESIQEWRIGKAPMRGMKELVLDAGSDVTRLMGGRVFLGGAKKILKLYRR